MELARLAQAELLVLHVAAPSTGAAVEPGSFRGPRYVDQPQHWGPARPQEFLGRMHGLAGGGTGSLPESFTEKTARSPWSS